MRATLTRRVAFRASHCLRLARLDEPGNRNRFGWTVDPHPHDYVCDVTVTGPLPGDGALLDLTAFDRLLQDLVVSPLEGRHLNDLVPEWSRGDALPTCEALAAWCCRVLSPRLPAAVRLERVRIAEDDTLWGECILPASDAGLPPPA